MSVCLPLERTSIEAAVDNIQGSTILTQFTSETEILRARNFSEQETVSTHAVAVLFSSNLVLTSRRETCQCCKTTFSCRQVVMLVKNLLPHASG